MSNGSGKDIIQSSSETVQSSNNTIQSSENTEKSSNEIIQSSNDAIQSSNDVIQSSNDTIKSSNETIQSSNDTGKSQKITRRRSSKKNGACKNTGTPTNHHAPAGQKYGCIEDAGICLLCKYYSKFPSTQRSSLAPPVFRVLYPEKKKSGKIKKKFRIFSKKEDGKYKGIELNEFGENAEYVVYQAFEKLIAKPGIVPILVLRSFQLDKNKPIRKNALQRELGINLSGINTQGEFDAVVLVKGLGLVLIEVKGKHSKQQQDKAETQLESGTVFFQTIMKAISGSSNELPIVTMVVFALETNQTSPASKSSLGNHIIHNDVITNFDAKWDSAVSELTTLYTDEPFLEEDYERLVHVTTGLWALEPFARTFTFNSTQSSSSYLVKQNDDMISQAIFSSDVTTGKKEAGRANPVTDTEYVSPEEIFRTTLDIRLLYLTPPQKELFYTAPQAIIRAPPGAGKSLLGTLKVIQTYETHPVKNILILAPHPHHLRLEKSLKLNDVPVTIIPEFISSTTGVVIMTLDNFFKVSIETFYSYDLSKFHLFGDDVQSMGTLSKEKMKYTDIAKFLNTTYATSVKNGLLLWFGVDEMQGDLVQINGDTPISLFHENEETPRKFDIPIIELKEILRNSLEISNVVQDIRAKRIKEWNGRGITTAHVPGDIDTGHRIRSECVQYHKLKEETARSQMEAFVKEQLTLILKDVLPQQGEQGTLNNSDIAVLLDDCSKKRADMIKQHVLKQFHVECQTIEEFIVTNDITRVIVDSTDNVMSFECPFVIYVRETEFLSTPSMFNLCSRARTRLNIIDICVEEGPFVSDDINLVQWEVDAPSFRKISTVQSIK